MPFKFAALDDAIVASANQEPARTASGGSHLLLSMAEMQGRKVSPMSASKTPYASGTTHGHAKTHGSVPHFRSKHGVSLINPLSSTFDSTKGDSSSYLTTMSVLETGESIANPYAAARSLDRQGSMRGNTTKTISNIDARLLPQTVSRSHGNAFSQRVPVSIRVTQVGNSYPNMQTHSNDYQIPQSEIVRAHLRSGHISSHTAAGTAAANVVVQRHPVKVSLQLPLLQGTTIAPTVPIQQGSPQYINKHAFPGTAMDRAVRSRMGTCSAAQKSSLRDPDSGKTKPVKFHVSPPQKAPITLKQVVESIQTENEPNDVVDLEIHEEKTHYDCNPNTEEDVLSEIDPDVLLINNTSTELIVQQAPPITPPANNIVESREKSPPMQLGDLELLQGEKTPTDRSASNSEDTCLSPAFKTLIRVPNVSTALIHPIEPGVLELNKSSTALKLSSTTDTRYSNTNLVESKSSPTQVRKKKSAHVSKPSSLRQSTAPEKDGSKDPEQIKLPKRLQSSTLSKGLSIASNNSQFLEHTSLNINKPITSVSNDIESHRNATNPSSLQTFYCNASSIALPQLNPTPMIDNESISTCVAPTPLSVKELLRHKHGLGAGGKGNNINIDPVVDIDVSIDTRSSSIAPTVSLTTADCKKDASRSIQPKTHSLSDSYLTASKHTADKESIELPNHTHKSVTCLEYNYSSRFGEGNQSFKPPDWAVDTTCKPGHRMPCHATRRFNMKPTPMRYRPPDSVSDRIAWTEGSVHTISSLASMDAFDGCDALVANYYSTVASDPETYAITVHTTALSSIFSSPLRSASQAKPSPLRYRLSLYDHRSGNMSMSTRRALSAPSLLQRCYVRNLMDDNACSFLHDSVSERVSIFYGTGLFKPITDIKLEQIRNQKPRSVAGSRADIQKCIQKLQDPSKRGEYEDDQCAQVKSQSFSGTGKLNRHSDFL